MKNKVLNCILGLVFIGLSAAIIFSVSFAIFSQPLNIIFYDGWSYLNLKQGLSPFEFHNEHNIFLANVLASVGPIFGKVFGSYNIVFAQILRIVCFTTFILTFHRLATKNQEIKNSFGFLFISLASLVASIFIFNPFSYRSLGWGFMLHWYMPLTILFLNGFIIYAASFKYRFCISYGLCLLAFFSGGHWIICFASVFLSFFSFNSLTAKSIVNNLKISIICLLPIALINALKETSTSGLMHKISSLKFIFVAQTIRHSFLDAFPALYLIIFLTIVLYYKFIKVDGIKFPRQALNYSLYLCFSGFLFALTVSIARGSAIDADYASGSYPTFVGLTWLGICTFYLLVLVNGRNHMGKYLYLLILPIVYLGGPIFNSQSNFNRSINTLRTERKWHVISYYCRRIGFIYQKHGFNIDYSHSCGKTYPNENRPYELWSRNMNIFDQFDEYDLDPNPDLSKTNLIQDVYKLCTNGNQSVFQPKFIENISSSNCQKGMSESINVKGRIKASETSKGNIIVQFTPLG